MREENKVLIILALLAVVVVYLAEFWGFIIGVLILLFMGKYYIDSRKNKHKKSRRKKRKR